MATGKIHFAGSRIGTFYLPQGADLKSAGVIYDRAYSAYGELKPGQLDWDKLLAGVSWFHFSAISPALNENVAAVCRAAVKAATERDITVSVDLNHRAKLWQWGKQPHDVMPALVEHCDVVMGNIWAANTMLRTAIDEKIHEGRSREKYLRQAKQTSHEIERRFPKVKVVANTFRLDSTEESITYYSSLYRGGELYPSPQYQCSTVVDRAGSGDCYMAGLIYGMYHQLSPQETVNFATAAAFGKLQEKGDTTNQSVEKIKENIETAFGQNRAVS
jgi:2-dehydro-3-deoxygluconokinase